MWRKEIEGKEIEARYRALGMQVYLLLCFSVAQKLRDQFGTNSTAPHALGNKDVAHPKALRGHGIHSARPDYGSILVIDDGNGGF